VRLAIFDFDGTLYGKETFPLMMDHLKNHPTYGKRYPSFLMKILPSYSLAKLKLYPTSKMQRKAMQFYINTLQGLTKEEVNEYFKEIAEKFTENFNNRVVDSFHDHVQKGDYTMLVSGAYLPLLKQATTELPFDKIIGTDIPFAHDKVDIKTPIIHVQGQRKTEAILEALEGQQIDWQNSYAYADSYSDLPVFDLVGNPIAVDPDERLENHAVSNKWTIVK